MAKNQLFQEMDLSHKPHRNGYDLSHSLDFTAKAGELLPLVHFAVNPFEKVKIRVNHFTRTSPVETAAQTRIKEYFDFFFVPYRLLWKDAPQVLTQNKDNPTYATSPTSSKQIGVDLPRFTFGGYDDETNQYLGSGGILEKLCRYQNSHGYNRGAMSVKLINHLRYCYIDNTELQHYLNQDITTSDWYNGQYTLSLFPLLAYQCIYYNFFRNTQWENNVPYNYNVDYLGASALYQPDCSGASSWANFWSNPTPFDLQYVNYPKDLFFGIFPDARFDDPAEVDVNGNAYGSDDFVTEINVEGDNGSIRVEQGQVVEANGGRPYTGEMYTDIDFASAQSTLKASFDIIQLRQAQFLQKYKEIIGSGRQDYRARIQKIFGGDVSDTLAQIPLYLGGRSSDIKISEIDNTNLGSDDAQAIQRGKGTGAGSSDLIEFEVPGEHGLIMCLYHSAPEITYSLNAHHFDVVRTEVDDFLNPVFDQLGFEEIPSYFLDLTLTRPGDAGGKWWYTLGYTTRYYDYKTMMGTVLGDLRETRKNYLTPVNFEYLDDYLINNQTLNLNANFFRVNPAILDPIFSLKANPRDYDRWQPINNGDSRDVWTNADLTTTDQLLVFCDFDIHLIRPIDYNGVPY